MRKHDLLYRIVSGLSVLLASSAVWASDIDGDGVPDDQDVCCNTPPNIVVDAQGRPKGDLDLDCDVDQSDFGIFEANMTGAMTCPAEGCACPCPLGLADCDGQPANWCEVNLNTNPVCGTFNELGTVRGDTGADVATHDAMGERWYRVNVSEDNSSPFPVSLTAKITLTPPPGINYDLFVYCINCGGTVRASNNGGSAVETIDYQHNDVGGSDDGRFLVIEVRYSSGSSCGNYHLEVAGNVAVTNPLVCP